MTRRPRVIATSDVPAMAARARPSLKENASPEEYGTAMGLCLGYAPSCSDAHECAQGGYCFTNAARGLADAKRKMKEIIAHTRNPAVRCWLRHAADAIENMEYQTRSMVHVHKLIEANRRFREENEHLFKKGNHT